MSMTDACQRDFFKICSFVSRCILVEGCTTRSSLVQVRPDLLYFISRGANPFEYGRIRGDLSACGCAWRGRVALPRDRRCTFGNFPLLITPLQPSILRSLLLLVHVL